MSITALSMRARRLTDVPQAATNASEPLSWLGPEDAPDTGHGKYDSLPGWGIAIILIVLALAFVGCGVWYRAQGEAWQGCNGDGRPTSQPLVRTRCAPMDVSDARPAQHFKCCACNAAVRLVERGMECATGGCRLLAQAHGRCSRTRPRRAFRR
jgi:hypothetical protein